MVRLSSVAGAVGAAMVGSVEVRPFATSWSGTTGQWSTCAEWTEQACPLSCAHVTLPAAADTRVDSAVCLEFLLSPTKPYALRPIQTLNLGQAVLARTDLGEGIGCRSPVHLSVGIV
jgi:hypothetical protein